MNSLDIAEQIIPGYKLLSLKKQVAFADTAAGQQLMHLVNSHFVQKEELESSYKLWNWFTGNYETKKQNLEKVFYEEKKELLDLIENHDDYQAILAQIICKLLKQEFKDFKLLTKAQQLQLSTAEFTKKMADALLPVNQALITNKQKYADLGFWSSGQLELITLLNELNIEKTQIIDEWTLEFQSSIEMEPLRQTITHQKELIRKEEIEKKRQLLEEHAVKLAAFFPLLNYRKFNTEESLINQLIANYMSNDGDFTSAPEKIDEAVISDLFFHCMHQLNEIEIDFVNLDKFNKKHARHMAAAVLKAFHEKTEIDLDSLFQAYENDLNKKILKQLHLINGDPWEKKAFSLADLRDSLSFLWNNKTVETANDFARKLAEAHAFIQLTGGSTQNENSYLAILDMYNYGRYYEKISEVKSIVISLLRPLLPLYEEYKNIAAFEKNVFWKFFRTIMPILIVVGTIIVTCTILALIVTPLALPELVFTAALIPALITGLGIASAYVSVKNRFYKSLREKFYGGPFEIPEFQINKRMTLAFGSKEKAERVRGFYINELKQCDKIEAAYGTRYKNGTLNAEEIKLRKDNAFKRHTLCMEWYDIHSNKELGFEKTPQIIINRLHITGDKEYKKLQKMLKNELNSFHQSVSEVTHDLKETIRKHNVKPVFTTDPNTTTIKENYRYGIFKQHTCFLQKARMEELLDLREQLSPAPCA